MLAAKQGVEIIPVWNKSNREHVIIGSEPASVRAAAAKAVKELGWKKTWHVDADHIRLETVDRFLDSSDFFTIDVADSIGKPAPAADISAFVKRHPELAGELEIPGISRPIKTTRADVERVAAKYLFAVQDAGQIYRHIAKAKGEGQFHHRSFHGRNRQPADAAGAAHHPGGDGRRKNSAPDHRAQIHRPLQQGRGLRRRCRAIRARVQRRPRRHRLCRQALRPAGKPQTQRPFRQRQVFHLSRHPPRAAEIQRRTPHQNRRDHLAGGIHRPGRSGRRRPGARQGDLLRRAGSLRRTLRALRHRH